MRCDDAVDLFESLLHALLLGRGEVIAIMAQSR
jgi:hypothetical protein